MVSRKKHLASFSGTYPFPPVFSRLRMDGLRFSELRKPRPLEGSKINSLEQIGPWPSHC
jgi:hypothetical protein